MSFYFLLLYWKCNITKFNKFNREKNKELTRLNKENNNCKLISFLKKTTLKKEIDSLKSNLEQKIENK